MKETFLSDWIEGRISDEQLRKLVSETDYQAYLKLRESIDMFGLPNPDIDSNFATVKQKLAAKHDSKRVKVLPLYKYAAVAAVLLVCFGLFQYFAFSNTAVADFGNTHTVVLSDHSKVTLNAKSKISYPSFFEYNRTIKLEGEAFFEVEKGSKFTVITPNGEIEVLGTKFNVITCGDFFEVVCFEGKVKVSAGKKASILTYGKSVRFYDGIIEKHEEIPSPKPIWMTGESGFRNVPLHCVISQLKNQYKFEIDYPDRLKEVRFTGAFTHNNIGTALQSICLPLNLKYSQTDPGKIIIEE